MAFTRSGVRSPSPPFASGEAGRGCRATSLRRASGGHRLEARTVAGIAQLVEHNLAKVGVAGSSPVSRSRKMGRWADGQYTVAGWSSLVARRAHNPEVVGSNPTPAIAG